MPANLNPSPSVHSPPMRPHLNIIGCGKLGRTLAKLWHQSQLVEIQAIINRSADSAQQACEFVGAGTPFDSLDDPNLPNANIWLIACADSEIAKMANRLQQGAQLRSGDTLFHCSGSLSSQLLLGESISPTTRQVCSVHPIHSFANPSNSVDSFADTFCAVEGSKTALNQISPLFSAIGGKLLEINGEAKMVYHAASVLACNALVGLLDASLECFQAAGIEAQQAQQLLMPIVHQTVNNTLENSPSAALTGPVSRGDSDTVATQLQQLTKLSPQLASVYRVLGERTLHVAKQQGLDEEKARSLSQLLQPETPSNR